MYDVYRVQCEGCRSVHCAVRTESLNMIQVNLIFRRARKIAKSEYSLRHVRPSVCPPSWNNPTPTICVPIKSDI